MQNKQTKSCACQVCFINYHTKQRWPYVVTDPTKLWNNYLGFLNALDSPRRGKCPLPFCGPPSPEVSLATTSLCTFCLLLTFLLRLSSFSRSHLFRVYYDSDLSLKPLLTWSNLILTTAQCSSYLNGLSINYTWGPQKVMSWNYKKKKKITLSQG